jgi:hypothetical protein
MWVKKALFALVASAFVMNTAARVLHDDTSAIDGQGEEGLMELLGVRVSAQEELAVRDYASHASR